MATNIETLIKPNGDQVLPRTRAKAVSMENGTTVETAINDISDKAVFSPSKAQVGQMIVVSEVDENGKPIAWEAVSPLKWELINELTLSEEDMVDVNRVTISNDLNGHPFRLERALLCYQWSKYTGEESIPTYCFLEINNRYAYGGYTSAVASRVSTNPTSGFVMVEILVPGKLVAERWGLDNWEVRDERYGAYTAHNRMGEVFSPEYEITEITSIGISNAYHLDGTIKLYGIRKEI